MSELAELWGRKSDDQLLDAMASLDDYAESGRQAIIAEFNRRGLAARAVTTLTMAEVEAVARLHRRFALFVSVQVLSVVGLAVIGGTVAAPLALLLVPAFLFSLLAVPLTGYQLLRTLGIERPGGLAFFMYMPFLSVLMLLGMRSFNGQWAREHQVEVGLLGPTASYLQRLRDGEGRDA